MLLVFVHEGTVHHPVAMLAKLTIAFTIILKACASIGSAGIGIYPADTSGIMHLAKVLADLNVVLSWTAAVQCALMSDKCMQTFQHVSMLHHSQWKDN